MKSPRTVKMEGSERYLVGLFSGGGAFFGI